MVVIVDCEELTYWMVDTKSFFSDFECSLVHLLSFLEFPFFEQNPVQYVRVYVPSRLLMCSVCCVVSIKFVMQCVCVCVWDGVTYAQYCNGDSCC